MVRPLATREMTRSSTPPAHGGVPAPPPGHAGRRTRGVRDSYHDSGKLVCHPDGRPVHADTITDRFNRLVDRAGVKHIRLHDVRHTYATVLNGH